MFDKPHAGRQRRTIAAVAAGLAASILLTAGGQPAFAHAPTPGAPGGPQNARPTLPVPPAGSTTPAQSERARKQQAAVEDLRAQAARQPQPDRATGSFQVSPAVGTFLRKGLGLPVDSNLLTGLARDKATGTLRVTVPAQPHLRFAVPAGVTPPAFGTATLVADPATGALTVTASGADTSLSVRIPHGAAGTLDFTSQVTVRVPVLGATVTVSGPLTYSAGTAAGVSLTGSLAQPVGLQSDAGQLDQGTTVTLTAAGIGVAGTADLGPAAHRLRVGVSGRLAGTDSWSLAVGPATHSGTAPVPGLKLDTAMTGTVTGDRTGVRYDVHAKTAGAWQPLPGVSVNGAVLFSDVAPSGGTLAPPGAGPTTAWLDVTGDVGLAAGPAGPAGAVASRGTVTVNLNTGAAALTAQQATALPMPGATGRSTTDRVMLDGARFAGLLTVKPTQISGTVTGTGVLTTTPTTGKRRLATAALRMDTTGVLTTTAPPTTVPSTTAPPTTVSPAAPGTAGPAARSATDTGTTTYTLSPAAYAFVTQKLGIPVGASPTISGTLSGQTLTLTVGAPGQLPLTLPAGVPSPAFGATTVTVDEATGTITLTANATAGVTATLQVTIRNAGTTTLTTGADLTATLTLGGVPFVAGSTVTLTGNLSYTGGTLSASLTGSLDSALSLPGGAVTLQAGANLSIATGTGLTVGGTAQLGSGDSAFTLTVNGTLTDLRNWSLSVTNPAGEPWQPVPGLTLYPTFSALLTDHAGAIGFDLNSTGTATWNPASGATLTVTGFEVSNQAPSAAVNCPPVAAGDVWLDLRGSFGYSPSGMAALTADGCVDLTSRSFQIKTTAPGNLLPNNPTFNLTNASLTARGNLTTRTFAVTGSAGVTVPSPSGPGVSGLTAAVSFSNNAILAAVEVPDLAVFSSNLAGSGTVYISSADITNFKPSDYGLTGGVFPSTIPLRAGVNIAYKYTIGNLPSNVTSALASLHVSVPSGTSILAVAQVSTTALSASLDINFGTDAGGAQLFNSNGAAFYLDDITLSITVGTTGGNVTLAGGGYLKMPKMWSGGTDSQVAVTASASLNLSTLSPVLSLRLSNWNNALGVPGLTVRNLAVSFAISPNPSIYLSADSVTLPSGWPQAVGIAAGAQVTLDATISLTQPVVRFWITQPSGGTALTPLAVGYAGQIAAGTPLTPGQQSIVDSLQIQSASFYLAPFGGTTATGLTIQPGLGLSFAATIDHVRVFAEASVGVAPPSLSIDVSTDNFSVGALTVNNTRFKLSINPTQFQFGFSGGYSYGSDQFSVAVDLVFGDSANGASLSLTLIAGLPTYLKIDAHLQGYVSGDGTGASLSAGGWGGFWANGHEFGSVYFWVDFSHALQWGDWNDNISTLVGWFIQFGASTGTIVTALQSLGYGLWDILNTLGGKGVFSSATLSTLESTLNPFSTTYYDIWTYTSAGQLLVLDVTNSSQTPDTQVITWTSNWPDPAYNQQWAFVPYPAAPGWYEVVNRNSGQCLSDYGDSTSAGSPLVQYPCFGGYDQLWYFGNINLATTYVVTNARSGMVMDVQSAYPWRGGTMDQWPYNGGTNQQFWLTNGVN